MSAGTIFVSLLKLLPRAAIRPIAFRYVAGETREDAFRVVRHLSEQGIQSTLDVLGEAAVNESFVRDYVNQYLDILDAIASEGLSSGISIKPTAFGLNFDEKLARTSISEILRRAQEHGIYTRIDMEDSPYTTKILEMYHQFAEEHDRIGIVLQSYMRRTLADIDAMPAGKADVRLCKGIYVEPEDIAFREFDQIRENYLAALRRMLELKFQVGIATHDQFLIDGAKTILEELQTPKEQFEFQMLYGVRTEVAKQLVQDGYRMRVYVPFGKDWYPYSMRRLYENPNIAMHVTRAVAGDVFGKLFGKR